MQKISNVFFSALTLVTLTLCGSFSTAHCLKDNSTLTMLRLVKCGLDVDDTAQLTDLLKNVPSLRVLDLSHNNVGPVAVEHLGNDISCVWGFSSDSLTMQSMHFK